MNGFSPDALDRKSFVEPTRHVMTERGVLESDVRHLVTKNLFDVGAVTGRSGRRERNQNETQR